MYSYLLRYRSSNQDYDVRPQKEPSGAEYNTLGISKTRLEKIAETNYEKENDPSCGCNDLFSNCSVHFRP